MIPDYEAQFGPVSRRLRRVLRGVRWTLKGSLGRERHLLVELNWRLGDEVMALPVLDALLRHHGGVRITVLTNYPDLFRDHPFVRVLSAPPADVDRYILLRGAPRREYRLGAYCAQARVPLTAARPALHYADWTVPAHLEIPEGDSPLIAVAPGASWPSKRWLDERWRALIDRLAAGGCRVVVLGQKGEGVPGGLDLTGKTSIRDAACVLHRADLLVCCDSGLMHLALAADTPVVALFGPTDPEILIRGEPRFTALCSAASCRGFWNHAETVGEPGVCPEGHDCCLTTITVDDVLAAVWDRLPAGSAP